MLQSLDHLPSFRGLSVCVVSRSLWPAAIHAARQNAQGVWITIEPDETVPDAGEADGRVKVVRDGANRLPDRKFDRIIFDSSLLPDRDYCHALPNWIEALAQHLAPDGAILAKVVTILAFTDWDVFNAIAPGSDGTMYPSSLYLFNRILAGYSVRPVHWLGGAGLPKGVAARIVRLMPLKATVLMIHAHSGGGKTTLVRSLQRRNPLMHVSSDYLFSMIQRMSDEPPDPSIAQLKRIAGGPTGRDAGLFFRQLEEDTALLAAFLSLVSASLPGGSDLVSFDIDLRKQESIAFAKKYLNEKGYSVWEVSR